MRAGRGLRAVALVFALVLGLVGCGDGDDGRDGPILGIQDDRLAELSADAAPRVATAADLGAQLIRVDLRWDRVAGFGVPPDPRNPSSSAYDWRQYDRVAAAAAERGVEVLFTIWGTPAWAADPSVPASDRYGPWTARPRRAQDLGDFAAAAAARYRPRGVRLWEVWNEPNIPLFLRPQYERRGGRWAHSSPRVYADLVRAMYRGIKSADPDAQVGIGVTAPFGARLRDCMGTEPECRIPPLEFLEQMLAAGGPPPMDAYSHHPYPLTPPRDTSQEATSSIDLYNLGRLESALDGAGLGEVPLWLSEFGFATRSVPEYRLRVDEADQARYLTDAVRRVRADPRVAIFVWYFLQDSPDWASGLLRQDGSRKPAAQAFLEAAAP